MNEIRNHFYRISIKALVLNEARDKFLIVKQTDGRWDLPGGGLEWGATPQTDIPREIEEEMGLKTTYVAEHPSYFLTCTNSAGDIWIANVLYEVELESLAFTPSDECTEVRFVNRDEMEGLDLFLNLKLFAQQFDMKKHVR